MSGFGKRKPSFSSRIFMGRTGIGKVRRTVGINSSRSSSIRKSSNYKHRSSSSSRPRRRLLEGVDQTKLRKIFTVGAFVGVVVIGLWVILLSANAGGREISMQSIPDADASEVLTADDTGSTVTIALGGSIKLQDEIITAAQNGEGYDFNSYLSELKQIMTADISIVNLVGAVDGLGGNQSVDGYPNANYPSQLPQALQNIGVNYAVTANSQILKNGYTALENTNKLLEGSGITPLGTYTSPSTGNTVLVKRVNSINIGIGAYNCLPDSELKSLKQDQLNAGLTGDQLSYCINQLSINYTEQNGKGISEASKTILADVQAMREAGAQIIIICINWGSADTTSPNQQMTTLAQRMIDAGVDITVGYGSDVTQKITVKEHNSSDGTKKKCYVLYSLGNLFSDCDNGSTQKKQESLVLNFTVTRDAGSSAAKITNAYYHPVYINRDNTYNTENTYLKYRVVPAARYVDASECPDIFSTKKQWDGCIATFRDMRDKIQSTWNVGSHFVLGTVDKVGSDSYDAGGGTTNV